MTVSAISVAGPRGECVPVESIRLRKDGKHTVVDAEIGGVWIEVIRELSDGEFCHVIEPPGMFKAYYTQPPLKE